MADTASHRASDVLHGINQVARKAGKHRSPALTGGMVPVKTAADSLRSVHVRPENLEFIAVDQGPPHQLDGRTGRPSRTYARRGRGRHLAGMSHAPVVRTVSSQGLPF